MEKTVVKVKVLKGGRMPERKSEGAAAFDCYTRLKGIASEYTKGRYEIDTGVIHSVIPLNGKTVMVPLGFALEMPEGVAAFIVPRSSLSRSGLILPNSIGVIDSDYRGEVFLKLKEIDLEKEYGAEIERDTIHDGDRLVQMLFNVPNVELVEAKKLTDTARGEGGFGSTGVR